MRTLRSSLRRLFPIKRTLRACATIASYPNSLDHRLTHGKCIPVSSAIRLRGILPNSSRMAFGVVLTFGSTPTSPGRVQDAVPVRPISQIVSRWPSIFPPPVLLQCRSSSLPVSFISGAFERDNLGAYRIPSESGLIIPSVCDSYLTTRRAVAVAQNAGHFCRICGPVIEDKTCAISFAFLAAFSLSVSTIHVQNLS
jgi:hypothetical protein